MENWKEIEGYSDYQISSLGNIKSLSRYVNHFKGGKRLKKEKLIKLQIDKLGYVRANLFSNNIVKYFLVHRLVANAFINNSENKPCVNHINGIKTDNRIENLEWCTYSENQKHSYKLGLNNNGNGDTSRSKKLNSKLVLEIRNSNLKQSKLAEIYKISQSQISMIKSYKSWSLLTNIKTYHNGI